MYDTPERTLLNSGKMLRVRVETPASGAKVNRRGAPLSPADAIITFKGPLDDRDEAMLQRTAYKVREECETHVTDANAAIRIIEALGFEPCFRYEKYRTTYRLPQAPRVLVELDETRSVTSLNLKGKLTP